MPIIHKIVEKIKPHSLDILIVALLVLSSSLGFILGRSSKIMSCRAPIVLGSTTVSNMAVVASVGAKDVKPAFFASQTGKYYYPSWCSAGSRVAPKNRVYFEGPEDAVSAGYGPSPACVK